MCVCVCVCVCVYYYYYYYYWYSALGPVWAETSIQSGVLGVACHCQCCYTDAKIHSRILELGSKLGLVVTITHMRLHPQRNICR